jgi:peptidoglycan hydrolase-like protein with peptidoglycan-binding domain
VGLASNHGDIGLWLRKHGCTFRDFRAWVQAALEEGVEVTYVDALVKEGNAVDHPVLRRGDSGSAVIYLQTLLGDTGAALRADGIFGAVTEAVAKEFQAINLLTMDVIVGPLTWAALEKATGHDGDVLELSIDENDTVSIGKSDWNAIRAAYAAISGIIRKYENVG